MSFKNVHLSLTEGHELNWLVVQLQLVDVFVHLYMRMSKKSDCECVRASERASERQTLTFRTQAKTFLH